MASNVFDPGKHYKIPLWGHGFTSFPEAAEPQLPGHFAADTVEVSPVYIVPDPERIKSKETEYAIFTVDEPQNHEYPFGWVGTYRIGMNAIMADPRANRNLIPRPEDQPTLAQILALYEIE